MQSLLLFPLRRWRLPVYVLLGAALLAGSFAVAVLALPSHAADSPSSTPPTSRPTSAEPAGRHTVAMGFVDVRDGVTMVLPLQPGRVKRVLARENQSYDAGAALYEMDDRKAQFDRNKAQEDYDASLVQLEKARKYPEQHRAALDAQQAGIEAKQAKFEAAQRDADEVKRLIGKATSAEKAAAAQKLADAAGAEVELERKKLRAMQIEDPETTVRLAERAVAAKKIQLDEAQWAVDECTTRAPYKGIVLRMQLNPGDSLPNPHVAPLLFCSSATPRIVRAEIEQEFAPKVYVGQPARVKDYTTDELGTWTGKVASISDWYAHRRSMLLEPLQFNDVRTLEAVIELDPGQAPLKIGQRVSVKLPVAVGH